MPTQEMQRHVGGVVDLLVARGRAGGGNAASLQAVGHGLGEGQVGMDGDALVGMSEGGQTALFGGGVGDEEAVAVQRRVGRGDHHDVGRVLGDAAGHLLVGGDGIRDARFLAGAHGGNDQRRMGNGVCGKKAHGTPSFEES